MGKGKSVKRASTSKKNVTPAKKKKLDNPATIGIAPGLAGSDFQIKLATFLICSGSNKNYEFNLRTENQNLGKLDDVVFEFNNKSGEDKAIAIQAKHTIKSNEKVRIKDLFYDDYGDFSVWKYYGSYEKAKNHLKKKICAVIYTNKDFDLDEQVPNLFSVHPKELKISNITEEITDEITEMLKAHGDGKFYRFKKKSVQSIMEKKLEDFEYKVIAEKLANCLEKRINIIRCPFLKKYKFALIEHVIDIKNNEFKKSFIDGRKNDSANLNLFRNILESTLSSHNIKFKTTKLKFNISKTFKKNFEKNCKIQNSQNESSEWPVIRPIPKEDIEDFLDNFIFAMNQPKESQLDEYIEKELGHFSCSKTKIIDEVRKWTKKQDNAISEPDENIITTESAKFYFTCLDREENQNNFEKPINEYEKKSNGIIFIDDFMEEKIETFLKSGVKIFHVSSECQTLTSLKIYKIFENKKYKDFILNKSSTLQNDSTGLESFETKLSNHSLLLFECDSDPKDTKIIEKIFKILKNCPNKKVIITGRKENELFANFKEKIPSEFEKPLEHSDSKISIDDLTVESKKKIFEQKLEFQNSQVMLGEILLEDFLLYKNKQFLFDVINDTVENIGKLYLDESDIKKPYIPRKLYFNIQLDENNILIILSDEMDLYSPFSIECAEFTQNSYIDDEMEISIFNRTRQKYQEKEICLLRKQSNKLTILKKTPKFDIQPDELIIKIRESLNKEIVFLSAPPGMGKSTTFTHLTKEIKKNDPTQWVYKIDLGKLSNELSCIQENETLENTTLNYFLERALKLDSKKEKILFEDYIQKGGKIVLLFDAFDEISPDYKREVIKLIQTFQNQSKTKRLYISTRPYNDILEDIPKTLNVLHCELQPLTNTDQRQYIKNSWSGENFNQSSFETFANCLFKEFNNTIKYNTGQFLGIPLHTEMISIVFKISFCKFCSSNLEELNDESIQEIKSVLRPSVLYERFIKIKHRENLVQKQGLNFNLPSVKKTMDTSYRDFVKEMKILALNYIFNEKINTILDNDELKELCKVKDDIVSGEKNGIIICIENNKPQFIHKTFAEYFSACYIVEKLKQGREKFMDFFLNHTINIEYETLCNFVDDLINLEDNIILPKEEIEKDNGKSLYFVIANECFNIAKMLIKNESNTNYIEEKSKQSIIHLKFNENEDVLEMLLESCEKETGKLKKNLQQRNSYELTPLLLAALNANANVIKILMDTLKKNNLFESEMNADSALGRNILHHACYNENKNVLLTIITELEGIPELLKTILGRKDNDKYTPLLLAAIKVNVSDFKMLMETLNKYDMFESEMNADDAYGRNILHNACFNENKDFLSTIITELEGVPDLSKTILGRKDNNKYTPLLLAANKVSVSAFKMLTETLKIHSLFESEMNAEDDLGRNILHYACFNENEDVLSTIITEVETTPELLKTMSGKKNNYGNTPLLSAAQKANVSVFKTLKDALIKHGIFESEMNADGACGRNILHNACLNEKKDVLSTIITEMEVNPESLKMMLRKKDNEESTPLLLAAQEVNVSTFEMLMETLKKHNLFESEINSEDDLGKNILHSACFNTNKNVMWTIITELERTPELLKTMLGKKNNNGNTPLFLAADKANVSILKMLMDTLKKYDLLELEMNAESASSRNILHYACLNEQKGVLSTIITEMEGNPESLKTLLRMKDIEKATPLLLAAHKGNVGVFKILAKTLKNHDLFESEINAVNTYGRNILHDACFNGNEYFFSTIITELEGTPELLKKMLRKKDNEKSTPLLLAAQQKNMTTFKILMETLKKHDLFESEMNAEDNLGRNVLFKACFVENKVILSAIVTELEETPELLKTMLVKKDNIKLTPLLVAANKANVSVFEILAETLKKYNLFESEMNAEDDLGQNLLHNVCYNKNKNVLSTIITELKGTPESLKKMLGKKNNNKFTPLLLAANKANINIFEMMMETLKKYDLLESEINAEDVIGRNILLNGCFNENNEVLAAIIKELEGTPESLKRMLEKKDNEESTPLILAALQLNISGYKMLTEILKKHNLFESEMNAKDNLGRNILQHACLNKNKDVLSTIITELEGTPELLKTMLKKKNNSGSTAIILAAKNGNVSVFNMLSDKLKKHGLFESEMNIECASGQNILHHACLNKNKNVLSTIITELERIPGLLKTMLAKKDNNKFTPLLLAARRGNVNTFKILTETLKMQDLFESEMNAEDNFGRNILLKACFDGNKDVLSTIITELEGTPGLLKTMLTKKNNNGNTPLLLAAQQVNANTFKTLIDTLKKHDLFKSEINTENASGRNILHMVCFNKNNDILSTIITELEGTPESLKMMFGKSDNNKFTPLLLAAQKVNANTFKMLTDTLNKHDLFKSEINAENASGRNILHLACFNKNKDILSTIITELEGTPELLKTILGKKNNYGNTALLLAANNANVSVFNILTETLRKHNLFELEMNSVNWDGDNILHNVCFNKNKDVLTTIITKLKEIPDLLLTILEMRNNHGRTPFLWAYSIGKMDIAHILNEALN